jgi:hypothetical protein
MADGHYDAPPAGLLSALITPKPTKPAKSPATKAAAPAKLIKKAGKAPKY